MTLAHVAEHHFLVELYNTGQENTSEISVKEDRQPSEVYPNFGKFLPGKSSFVQCAFEISGILQFITGFALPEFDSFRKSSSLWLNATE